MKQAFLLLLCLICSIALSACSDNHQKNTGKYKPVVNPNPKYFVTISGKYTLPKNKVWFVATYDTENDQCYKVVSEFEGAYASRDSSVMYLVVPKSNRYSLRIPTEHYLPGKCKWRLEGISYVYGNKDANKNSFPDVVSFSGVSPENQKKGFRTTSTLACSSANPLCFGVGPRSWIPTFSRRANNQITINFIDPERGLKNANNS